MTSPSDGITIDGFGPLPVLHPATVPELCESVRRCAADGQAIYPVGGGTMLDYGRPPSRPGVAIAVGSLHQVIDFPVRDLTITVQTGITVAHLHEITRAEGLDLPIDVPEPERATLGGAISCNVSGPRRLGYGTFRDYILGITVVTDRGEEAKAGGRVVKNVAGYDLMKLHTGALGTLGILTQVTLKLRPVPEAWGACLLRGHLDDLAPVLDRLHTGLTRPVGIDLTGPADTGGGDWFVTMRFDGHREAVEWQVDELFRELAGQPFKIQTKAQGTGVPPLADLPRGQFVVRVNLRPSGVADLCRTAATVPGLELRGQAGSGVLRGGVDVSSATAAGQIVETLQQTAARYEGNVVIEHCPSEWKSSLPVWGRPPAALKVMHKVKHALDPHGLFNPGRFVTDP